MNLSLTIFMDYFHYPAFFQEPVKAFYQWLFFIFMEFEPISKNKQTIRYAFYFKITSQSAFKLESLWQRQGKSVNRGVWGWFADYLWETNGKGLLFNGSPLKQSRGATAQ